MSHRTIVAIALFVSLGGCAISRLDDVAMKEALQERQAASIRLSKAIMRYCAVRTDTLESRNTCILEQRLLLLHEEPSKLALKMPASSTGFDKPFPSRQPSP